MSALAFNIQPVRAEPTTIIVPTDDSSVAFNFPETNYGSDDRLIVHYWPQGGIYPTDEPPAARRNAYLKFDLSSVSGLFINSATLKIYACSVGYEGSEVGVYFSSDNSWDEETITGNNAPPHLSVASDTVLVMEKDKWYSLDVTSDVITALNKGVMTEVLRIENTTGTNHDIRFWSKEYSDEQYHPQLVIAFTAPPPVPATVDIDLATLNLRSKGEWVTAYIELPKGYYVSDIDVSSIRLNDTIQAELKPTEIGDYDSDGIRDLMVKFNRAEIISLVLDNISVERRFMTATLTITGYLNNGTQFNGSDTIRIIVPRWILL
jgi:hypothetical protein